MIIKKIDILNCLISNNILIEASAGTGKTFSIIIFYIRLLLNIGINEKYNSNLSVQEILVLTFTNKSKSELINRIKETINSFKNDCIQKTSKNKILNTLIMKIKNLKKAILILEIAANNIHYASIFTIHKFCQNIINENKFNFYTIFKKEIISDKEQFYYDATIKFWRKYCYKLPKNVTKIIYQYWKEPKLLLFEIKPLLQQKITVEKSNNFLKKDLVQYHINLILKIKIFKKSWLSKKKTINYLIETINHLSSNNKTIKKWKEKINLWAQNNTEDYHIPKELLYFYKTIIKKNNYKIKKNQKLYLFLKYMQKFLKNKFSIKEIFIYKAFIQISKIIRQKKYKSNLLDFDDLISTIYLSLNKNNSYLSKLIRKKYPVILIDEFQDIDHQQYKIFEKIYEKQNKLAFILIADPKQSIYSFRGANIYSYLKIKAKIKSHYYLDTNWRSSLTMVNSVNTLFSKNKNPFLIKKIKFIKTSSADNLNMYFKINNIKQPGLKIFFKTPNSICCTNEYLDWASKQCAYNICKWLTLSKSKQAKICINNKEKTIKPRDIAILVRNKNEANIINNTLNTYNLSSTYQSSKDIVYKTKESIDLLYILKSIIEPSNKQKIRQALITDILSLSIYEIDHLNNNNELQLFFVNKFINYLNIWTLKGIYYLIKTIITDSKSLKNLEYINNNKPDLNNILHIAELLQERSNILLNKQHLLSWFENKIYVENNFNENEYIRLNENSNNINIVTIHKSKGLEYPLVWLPFSINFFQKTNCIFYNQKNLKQTIDLYKNYINLKISKKEQQAEEIRLTYVALTRSILHCSTCIAPLIKGNRRKTITYTDIHKSGLGYILQQGQKCSKEELKSKLLLLNKSKYIKVISEETILTKYSIYKKQNLKIVLNNITRTMKDNWKINSYSKLNHNYEKKNIKNIIKFNNYAIEKINTKNSLILTTHNFPKGKLFGNLLHKLLKNHNFSQDPKHLLISKEVKKNNLSLEWVELIKKWIYNITNTSLNLQKIILSKLKPIEYIKEFEFCLSIKKTIYSNDINNLLKSFSSISETAPNLKFDSIKGILTGFIDLVFFWNNKYYFIDYKSNWLGENNKHYTKHTIHEAIIKHRYDLQYQLYSVALHRYLKIRIHNYSLKTHFGGIFYLFIRAFNEINQKNGIFFTIPSYNLIKKLDKLLEIT